MLLVTQYLQKPIDNSAFVSKWYASENPMILKLQRRDNSVGVGTGNDGGFLKVGLQFGLPAGYSPQIGDSVYVGALLPGTYNKVYNVTHVYSPTLFTVNAPYAGIYSFINFNSGVYNSSSNSWIYKNYYLSTDIYFNGAY